MPHAYLKPEPSSPAFKFLGLSISNVFHAGAQGLNHHNLPAGSPVRTITPTL